MVFGPGTMSGFATRFNELQDAKKISRAKQAEKQAKALQEQQKEATRLQEKQIDTARTDLKNFKDTYSIDLVQKMTPTLQKRLMTDMAKIYMRTGVPLKKALSDAASYFAVAVQTQRVEEQRKRKKTSEDDTLRLMQNQVEGKILPPDINLLQKESSFRPEIETQVDTFSGETREQINKKINKRKSAQMYLRVLNDKNLMARFGGRNKFLQQVAMQAEKTAKETRHKNLDAVNMTNFENFKGIDPNLGKAIEIPKSAYGFLISGIIPPQISQNNKKEDILAWKNETYFMFLDNMNTKLKVNSFKNLAENDTTFKNFIQNTLNSWEKVQPINQMVKLPNGGQGMVESVNTKSLNAAFPEIKKFLGDNTTNKEIENLNEENSTTINTENGRLKVGEIGNNLEQNLEIHQNSSNVPKELQINLTDIDMPENLHKYKDVLSDDNIFLKHHDMAAFFIGSSPRAIAKLKSQSMKEWLENTDNQNSSFARTAKLALAYEKYSQNVLFKDRNNNENDTGATPANTNRLYEAVLANSNDISSVSEAEALNNFLNTMMDFEILKSGMFDSQIVKLNQVSLSAIPLTHSFAASSLRPTESGKELPKTIRDLTKKIESNSTLSGLMEEVLILVMGNLNDTDVQKQIHTSGEKLNKHFVSNKLDTFVLPFSETAAIGREGETLTSLQNLASFFTGTLTALTRFFSFEEGSSSFNKMKDQLSRTEKYFLEDMGYAATKHAIIDGGRSYRTNLNTQNQTFLQKLDNRMKALTARVEKNRNDPVIQRAALIEMNKIALTYRLSGIVQGDTTGGRTISNADFEVMYRAIWGNNSMLTTQRLQLLYSRVTNDINKFTTQKKLLLEGGDKMLEKFGYNSPKIKPFADKIKHHYVNKFNQASIENVRSDRDGIDPNSYITDKNFASKFTDIVYKTILKEAGDAPIVLNVQGAKVKDTFRNVQEDTNHPIREKLLDLAKTIEYLQYIPQLSKNKLLANIVQSENPYANPEGLTMTKMGELSADKQLKLFEKYSDRAKYEREYINGYRGEERVRIIEHFLKELEMSMFDIEENKSRLSSNTRNTIRSALNSFLKNMREQHPDLEQKVVEERPVVRPVVDAVDRSIPVESTEVRFGRVAGGVPIQEVGEEDLNLKDPRDIGSIPESVIKRVSPENSEITNAFNYVTSPEQEGEFFPNPSLDASKKGNIIGYSMMIDSLDPEEKRLLGGDLKNISETQAQNAAKYRINTILKSYKQKIPNFENMEQRIKNGLVSAMYQIGPSFIPKFPKMMEALKEEKFNEAAWHYLHNIDKDTGKVYSTEIAKQTPERAERIARSIGNPEAFRPSIKQGGL